MESSDVADGFILFIYSIRIESFGTGGGFCYSQGINSFDMLFIEYLVDILIVSVFVGRGGGAVQLFGKIIDKFIRSDFNGCWQKDRQGKYKCKKEYGFQIEFFH